MRLERSEARGQRRPRLRSTCRPLAPLLALLLLGAAPLPAQISASDLPPYDPQEMEQLLQASLALFQTSSEADSVQGFTQLLEAVQGTRGATELSPAERAMVVTALEYRGQAFFNQGETGAAEGDFRSLLAIKPGHRLDEQQISPKIVKLFRQVRDSMIGSLRVTVLPPGSTLVLDGQPAGLTDGEPIFALAGAHPLEVTRPGYDPYRETVAIAAGQSLEVGPISLLRTMATCRFLTIPDGVEVFLDGRRVGVTVGPPGEEARQALLAAGQNPAAASDFFLIPDIRPGLHRLELRKECFVTLARDLNFAEPTDYLDEPRILEPSRGTIVVRAAQPASRISLDGAPVGTGSLVLEGICSGEHSLAAAHEGRRFFTTITLEKGARVEVEAILRPTIAFAGFWPRLGLRDLGEEDPDLLAVRGGLSRLQSLNVAWPEEEAVRALFREQGIGPDHLPPRELPAPLVTLLGRRLECNLFLLAARDGESLELRLYSTLHGRPELEAVEAAAGGLAAAAERLAARLEARPPLERPWIGLQVADAAQPGGLPAILVTPGSPAAAAGLQVGDLVSALGGRPLRASADLSAAVTAAGAGGSLSLVTARGGAAGRTATLEVGTSPLLLPPLSSDFLYNRVTEDLRALLGSAAPGSEAEAFLRLNLAVCLLHADLPEAAGEMLQGARIERPAGISQGTLLYYRGLAAAQAGRAEEAAALFAQVQNHPQSTLVDDDGPAAWLAAAGLAASPGRPRGEAR